jgi:ribosome-associated toxin RatA of RatAB toxin-antitoxin module
MKIHKRVLIPYSAEQMFDLIEAAEHYPAFMPWCARAAIVERSDEVVIADIGVNFRGVSFEFRTRNPKRRPVEMSIRLERGPFRRFEGEWRVTPLGEAGCRVEFEMRYDFNSVMARVAGPVFDRIANSMVDAYVARADALYGRAAVAALAPTGSAAPATTSDDRDAAPPIPGIPAAFPAPSPATAPKPVTAFAPGEANAAPTSTDLPRSDNP